jgi:hypothetical protein
MSASEPSFRATVDPAWSAEQSIVLRYREAVSAFDDEAANRRLRDLLARASIREGVRISRWTTENDVRLGVLDETSLMHTGSMKAVDGCFSTAMCLMKGYDRVVFESGGNTGRALTAYLSRAGVETFLFVPAENVDQLDGDAFRASPARLIAVDRADKVKRAARLFARLSGLPKIPETGWRYVAAELRGHAVLEHVVQEGGFDWIAQTISAGFGPIGIYKILRRHAREAGPLPRFLGVQQEENCPVYRAWRYGDAQGDGAVVRSTSGLLNKVMYDSAPQTYGSLGALREVLTASAGRVTTVSRAEIDAFVAERAVPELLAGGFDVDPDAGQPAALMTLAGVLKEIRAGAIARGSRVLCLLTGGASRRREPPEPGLFRRLSVERIAR